MRAGILCLLLSLLLGALLLHVLRHLLRPCCPWLGARIRKVGTTAFADPAAYHSVVLSSDQKDAYFRDGAVAVRGALRRDTLAALREAVLSSVKSHGLKYNVWMESDELLDFVLHGPLAALASQLFSRAGAGGEEGAAAAFFWMDYLTVRPEGGGGTGWHMDVTECEGDLPANYTDRALPRFLLPLDDGMPATEVLSQTAYAAGMGEAELGRYWSGDLPWRVEGRFDDLNEQLELPPLPRLRLHRENATTCGGLTLQAGDVLIFNTCLWHRAPPARHSRGRTFAMLLAYAPASKAIASSRFKAWDPTGMHCRHGLPVGARVGSGGSPCFPLAYPGTTGGLAAPPGRRLLLVERERPVRNLDRLLGRLRLQWERWRVMAEFRSRGAAREL